MTIIIVTNPFESHFLALMDFAENMKTNGYDVIFLGYKKTFSCAENYAYKYVQFKTFEKEPSKYDAFAMTVFYNEMQQILSSYVNPFVLLPASRFHLYFNVIYEMKLKFLLYSLCCGADRINMICPPNTSDYFPQKYGRKNIIVLVLWVRRYIRMEFHNLRQHKYDQIVTFINYWVRYRKRPIYGLDGFYVDYPKIIFGSKEFNLYSNSSNLFWGLGVARCREVENYSYKVVGKKNIYCTFGTMSYRYIKMPALIDLLLYVVSKHNDWNLILQMDDPNFKMKQKYNNVTVVEYVSQLNIIKEFDVVICHGGFGTIKECIYYETPILVFPCSYDQHGNAARVDYFKIGIRSKALSRNIWDRVTKRKMINLSAEELDKMICELLNKSQYRKNIGLLHEKITDMDEKYEVISYINERMNNAR